MHYPCEGLFSGHIKAVLRVAVDPPYLDSASQQTIIDAVLRNLGIPSDETYEAFFRPAEQVDVLEDRGGHACWFVQWLPEMHELGLPDDEQD